MKKFTWPENNAVRLFRYYQKLTALRHNPERTFSPEIYHCGNSGDSSVKRHSSSGGGNGTAEI